jgi:hypothetical protein
LRAAFGLDSLIEILASLVVVWQLQDLHAAERERRALRIIGVAFLLLAAYISAQSIYVSSPPPIRDIRSSGSSGLRSRRRRCLSSPPPSAGPAALSATAYSKPRHG